MPKPGHLFDAEYQASPASARLPVRVRFDTRGLAIEREGAAAAIWPYAGIGTLTPSLPSTSSRVVLTSTGEAGATLTVDSRGFLDSIVQAAPKLRAAPVGPSWLPMVWASLGVAALVGGLIWALVGLFPYKAVARRIPEETRTTIGELALAEITKEHKKCEATAGGAALSKLVDRLANASGTGIKFKVQVVDWKLVNAFTVMGNQIVLTKGLLQASFSPDEVAGVLGHEMGHAIEVHPEAGALRALGTMIGVQLLLGGWTPDMASLAASQLLLLKYGRGAETEADEIALRLLKEAKISAAPFAGFFDKIAKEEEKAGVKGARLPDVFSSHPPPPERAKRAKAQPDYPATPALESGDWEALKKICG